MYDKIEQELTELEENLHKWFKEKWVRFGPDGKIRGDCAREKSSEGKPKCRPLKSAQGMGKKARATAARRKRREDPNPDRKGKAKNVKTESDQMDELKCWKGYTRVQGVPAGAPGSCKKKTEESITPDTIHKLADELGISWDNEPSFLELTKKLTGKEHLDDLDQAELMTVKRHLEKQNIAEIEESTMDDITENHICPICQGELVSEMLMNEKKDACYYKVKSRYDVWPSAYASGALVKCRKKGAKNWGNKSEGFEEVDEACWKGYHKDGMKTMFGKKYPNCVKNEAEQQEELDEKWSKKYKSSIDCSHPKGFSQKAHCQGRKKTNESIMKEEQLKNLIREMVEEMYNEQSQMQDECLECYESAMQEGTNEIWEDCYRKTNLDMIPEGDEHTCEGDEFYEIYGDMKYEPEKIEEAEYQGRKVKLGVPMKGDVKKSKVYVKNPKGNVVKVNFGDKKMRIKKSIPKRRKSFRARHNCANPGPRHKARYWSCRAW